MEEYFLITSKWEDFTHFCNRIADELGDTLYKVADPFFSEGKIFVRIPEKNANRILGVVSNFSGTYINHNITRGSKC